MTDSDLLEFKCPDCLVPAYGLGSLPETLVSIRDYLQAKPSCPTCGGSKKVLVKRSDLIRVTTR